MPEHDTRNAADQVDPEFRWGVEWLRTHRKSAWTIDVQVEDEGRTQTLLLKLADAPPCRVLLRKDGRSFPLPQTPDALMTYLRQLCPNVAWARWVEWPC